MPLDNLTYLGEWHTRPSDDARKSMDGVRLYEAIDDYNRRIVSQAV